MQGGLAKEALANPRPLPPTKYEQARLRHWVRWPPTLALPIAEAMDRWSGRTYRDLGTVVE